MNIDTQEYLDLVEETGKIAFFDIEATGLRGDYNSIICVSVKPYDQDPITLTVKQAGNDKKLVRETKELLEQFSCWCGYYSKGFDIPMITTRLLKWGYDPLNKKPHLDMYYALKYNLLTARRSQGHLLSWLETPEEKMTVGADMWNQILYDPVNAMKTIVDRCESDVTGLEALYKKTRQFVKEIKR